MDRVGLSAWVDLALPFSRVVRGIPIGRKQVRTHRRSKSCRGEHPFKGLNAYSRRQRCCLAVTIWTVPPQTAFALITGGKGNRPLADPGWPTGAAAIFNNPVRIAWWEGPPLGGGQYHAECRGDTKAFNAVLADFAKLDVNTKRLIVHDGVGHSFWLNPNRKPEKRSAAKVDWSFTVWVPASWERLRKMPAELKPTDLDDANHGPPAEIEVYTGGGIRWSEVAVPKGVEVVDKRLEAHGFTPADGIVFEGKVVDLATQRSVSARIQLERIEPLAEGGYDYSVVLETVADEQGRWVLKNSPPGWHRVVVKADGYVPRIVGHVRSDEQPRWHSYDCGLSRPAAVSGRVTDGAGKPLADVEVRFGNAVSSDNGRYESPPETLDQDGCQRRFLPGQCSPRKCHDSTQETGLLSCGFGGIGHSAESRRCTPDGQIVPDHGDRRLCRKRNAPKGTSCIWNRKEVPPSESGRDRGISTQRIKSCSGTFRREGTSCMDTQTPPPATRKPSRSRSISKAVKRLKYR